MTEDRSKILQRIETFDDDLGWYQDIDLKCGLSTKSRRVWGEDIDHPRKRFAEVSSAVPQDMSGMSVLDIGCNAGYFAFEAKDRGADYVCGVDIRQGYIDQANFCAEVRSQDVDFQVLDIYNLDKLGRRFDFVFCVGILYHCKHLSMAVDQVGQVSAQSVVVETAIHPGNLDLPLVRFVRSSGYKGADAHGAAKLPGHWHPNMTALVGMFLEQGFSDVRKLFVDGGRGGIAAYR